MSNLVPAFLKCPITGQLFNDPVVAIDGYTYERSAIEQWLRARCVSPVTLLPMQHSNVYPSRTIISLVTAWRAGSLRCEAPQRVQPLPIAAPPAVLSIPQGDLSIGGACVGRGSYKTVYRGDWRGREVAVATMLRGAVLDAELRAMMSTGLHPHILQVHGVTDVADDPSQLHIISELAPMGSLSDVMSRGQETGEITRIVSPVILAIAMQICEAMIAVTRAGFVHRDLGARNILAFEFASNLYFSVYVKVCHQTPQHQPAAAYSMTRCMPEALLLMCEV